MSPAKGTLRGRVMAGSFWLILLRSVSRVLGFTSTIILARLLMPEDFGLMAMAAVSMAFLEAFTTLNLGTILIRNALSSRPDYDTAWTLQIIRGTIIALVIVLAGPAIAGFFEEPRLIQILPLVALASFVNGFHNIGMVDLEKEFRFQGIVIKESLTRVSAVILQIILAVVWRNYWALIAGIVCQSFVAVALSYSFSPYRPKLSLARCGEIFGFAKWLTASSIAVFLREQCDALIIGRILTPDILGTYVVGRNLVHMPSNEIIAPVCRATFPAYAKISGDPEALQRAFLMMLASVFALAAPACAGIGLISEPLILGLFGDRWLPAADVMPILAIGAIISSTGGVFGQMLIVLGRPDLGVYAQVVALVLYIPALVVGIGMAEAMGAATARSATTMITFSIILLMVARLMSLRLRDMLAVVWRSVAALVVMAAAIVWAHSTGGLFGIDVGPIGLLVQLVLVGGLSYGGALMALWLAQGRPSGAEEHVFDMMTRIASHQRLAFIKQRMWSHRS
jgi:O-antigen/teichoic acid export membrane protein